MLKSALIAILFFAHGGASAQDLAQAKDHLQREKYVEAIGILTLLANKNDAEAQRLLGEVIFKGQGVRKNLSAAFTWTELSAKNGDAIAQFNLGHFYEHGLGIASSTDQATKWYERSGSQGLLLAQRRLGQLYSEADPQRALYWYNEARMQGDSSVVDPLTRLGVLEAKKADELREAERVAERRESAKRSRELELASAREERQRANVAAGIARDFQQLGQQMGEQSQRIGAASRGTTVEAERANVERVARGNDRTDEIELTATSVQKSKNAPASDSTTDYQTWLETCGGMCTREEYAKRKADDAQLKQKVRDHCAAARASGNACTTSR